MQKIGPKHKEMLVHLAGSLLDQEEARVVVPPKQNRSGYWFGAGNGVEDREGALYLAGRYRNAGDSRSGLQAGQRGVELAVFKSSDGGATFDHSLSLSKSALSYGGREVVSIEGCCLRVLERGVELYVSTEKKGSPYPPGLEEFQKPGTGVWSIDLISARSFEGLSRERPRALLESKEPLYLHVKDPFVFSSPPGHTIMLFCTHPFSWSSAGSAFAIRPEGSRRFGEPRFDFFARGPAWDVAISRITGVLQVPRVGAFADLPSLSLYFYDGGESMHSYEEHSLAVKRPRGYSCEEIGGLAWSFDQDFPHLQRLSPYLPLFVSPYGTGSSRYARFLRTRQGIFAFWQQSRNDFSQPLVAHFLSNEQVGGILRAR
jgi:hypothetical protein